MSIDKSLKIGNRLVRRRSVLTRAERLTELEDSERWKKGDSIYGLPKVRVKAARKRVKAPKAAEAVEAAPGAEGVEAAPGAEGAEAAPGAEGAEAAAETPEKKKA